MEVCSGGMCGDKKSGVKWNIGVKGGIGKAALFPSRVSSSRTTCKMSRYDFRATRLARATASRRGSPSFHLTRASRFSHPFQNHLTQPADLASLTHCGSRSQGREKLQEGRRGRTSRCFQMRAHASSNLAPREKGRGRIMCVCVCTLCVRACTCCACSLGHQRYQRIVGTASWTRDFFLISERRTDRRREDRERKWEREGGEGRGSEG